jgi:ribulose-phosphate 3-epimerase
MRSIVPAILPTSRLDLDAKLLKLRGLTDEVQIDIVDGRFVTPASWPYVPGSSPLAESDSLAELGSFKFEVDLMVEGPSDDIKRWVRAGATRITVHAETALNLGKVVDDFQTSYGHDKDFVPDLLSFGLAINLATDAAILEPYLDRCDYVQFMGIAQIGKQGEPFDRRIIPKIQDFHKKYPAMPIQIDGAVSLQTAPDLLAAGASRLVVGSALWRAENVEAEFARLEEVSQTYGLYA